MDPIFNPMQFSHDYQKFVLQNPNVQMLYQGQVPEKPFAIKPPEKNSKSKKDLNKKKKRPFEK